MDLRLGSEIWDESEIWSEMDLDRSGLMIWIWYWRKMMDLDRSGLMIWIWYWGKMMYISEDRTSKWDLASCQRKNVIIRGYPVFIKSWKSIFQKIGLVNGIYQGEIIKDRNKWYNVWKRRSIPFLRDAIIYIILQDCPDNIFSLQDCLGNIFSLQDCLGNILSFQYCLGNILTFQKPVFA